MSFPKYPKYKDSGLPWLGMIPDHWQIGQSRRRFSQRKDRANHDDRQLTASQKYGVIYQDDFMSLEGQKVMQVLNGSDILKRAEPNDFVISMRSFQGGIEWCGVSGSISSAYVMLIPDATVHAGYFRYLFKSTPYIQALQSTSNLVRDGQALRFDNFAQIDLPLLPISEQACIAQFLDFEISKIDALIAEQQRLIELLKEKRQAVISHAVTKGLNPNAPMKDSGIEWIGEVPTHWDVKRLKYIASLKGRLGWQGLRAEEYTDSGPYLVTSEHFSGETIDWNRCHHVTFERYELAPEIQLKPDDLLIMKDGAAMGKLAYIDELPGPACLNSHLLLFRPRSGEYRNKFLFFLLGTSQFKHYMNRTKTGTTFFGISQESIGDFIIPLPHPSEQDQIVSFLVNETNKIDALIAEQQRLKIYLQERRTALISAAVTGKIDVRNYTPPPTQESPA